MRSSQINAPFTKIKLSIDVSLIILGLVPFHKEVIHFIRVDFVRLSYQH